ncbi:hypothetical protein DHL47_13325 [Streptococcus panodentis]|uniref:Uncharacterized protein n=1 Tax=Streptococcus panodentis TaxID=1581472 RepID=A0ABS5B189_9STRE|nr:hypothetical protein [Streptococcus panodentis]
MQILKAILNENHQQTGGAEISLAVGGVSAGRRQKQDHLTKAALASSAAFLPHQLASGFGLKRLPVLLELTKFEELFAED